VPHATYAEPDPDAPAEPELVDPIEDVLVSLVFASWSQLDGWLRQVEALRRAA
jgi:hypothetical protein